MQLTSIDKRKGKLLTNKVASVNGTSTLSDLDKDLTPPVLNPIKVPTQVMLLPNKRR